MTLNDDKIKNDPAQKDIEFILKLFKSNKLIEAKKEINKIIKEFPTSSILYNILGAVFSAENNFKDAIEKYKKAIEINPKYAQAYNNFGVILQKLDDKDKAIYNFKKAISLKDNFFEALNNIGNLYQDIGDKKEALLNFKKVIKIKPNYAEAYNNIGLLLNDLSRLDEALLSFKKAIKLKPNNYKTYNNLGNLFNTLGKYDEASLAYTQSIKIKSDNAAAYSNFLLNLNYKEDFDEKLYLDEAKKFSLNCKPKKKILFKYQYEKNPKKLKIGFVSADFGNHPGGFFTLSTLRELRKKNFELNAYVAIDRTDEYSSNFKPLFTKWNLIEKKKDEEVARNIIDDGIHILIDLQGHSANNRLPIFMYKPAPIQATWLGQGSSGISEIDYFIGSSHTTPQEEEKNYIEKILRFTEISQCFTPPSFNNEISSLPAIKNNYITFGSFNKSTKINNNVIDLWSKILLSVTNSKLLLKNKDFDDQTIAETISTKFKQKNINKNRLLLLGESKTRKELLETYNKIDIALDPFPFQGNTSTCEAVWMGVPVITLKGNRYLFHFGESINTNLHMHDWIANNFNEYINKSIKFSSDIEALSKIRKNLREVLLKSPVCDAPRFTKHLSNMLWDMWQKFCSK